MGKAPAFRHSTQKHQVNTQHHYGYAIVLTLLGCCALASMDAVGKYLMQTLHPAEVIWGRYFFHTLLIGLFFGRQHYVSFYKPQKPGLQLLRGLCLLGVTLGMYFAIREVPLADATAVMFFAPVLVTLFAAWLLKEKIRSVHWLAISIGFAGVLLVIQPGFSNFNKMMLLPLISAVTLALYFVLTRKLQGTDSAIAMTWHATLIGTVSMSLVLPLFWQAPTTKEWLLLLATGSLGAIGHLVLIRAFLLAPAISLSPFLNAQILAAALFGYLLFADGLSNGFVLGATLIVLAGLLTWRQDRRNYFSSL
jgi:drug/metabolite transporter (DMT)-like permease